MSSGPHSGTGPRRAWSPCFRRRGHRRGQGSLPLAGLPGSPCGPSVPPPQGESRALYHGPCCELPQQELRPLGLPGPYTFRQSELQALNPGLPDQAFRSLTHGAPQSPFCVSREGAGLCYLCLCPQLCQPGTRLLLPPPCHPFAEAPAACLLLVSWSLGAASLALRPQEHLCQLCSEPARRQWRLVLKFALPRPFALMRQCRGATYSEHSGSPRHWCLSPCSCIPNEKTRPWGWSGSQGAMVGAVPQAQRQETSDETCLGSWGWGSGAFTGGSHPVSPFAVACGGQDAVLARKGVLPCDGQGAGGRAAAVGGTRACLQRGDVVLPRPRRASEAASPRHT